MVYEEATADTKKRRGRPASAGAVSHEQILDAVQAILQEKSVRDLTMEEVARSAGVGKPTLYKWWPSKAALVLDLFEERMVGTLDIPHAATAEEDIRTQARELIRLLGGFFGKVARELIAEGQSDPSVLVEYRERYLSKRRAYTRESIARAKETGEFRKDIDADVLIDMLYGPIYYRLLVQHAPLDAAFADKVIDDVLTCVKTR